MIDVIITGSIVFTGSEVIEDGYVYVRNGRVEDIGQQPPPEDYTYATLVLGGQGRIVAPGLTAMADIGAYIIRLLKPSMKDRLRFYKAMSSKDLARASLAGVYELHMNGVTSIIAEGVDFSYINELRELAGGRYGLAIPACLEEGSSPPEWSLGMVRVAGKDCRGEHDISEDDMGEDGVLALFSRVTYTLEGIRNAWDASAKLRALLGLGEQSIRKGSLAEIVIFNVRRPPGMLLDMAGRSDPEFFKEIYSYGLRVETLLVGDEVLVDGGEHLNIVDKHFSDIRRLASRILVAKQGE